MAALAEYLDGVVRVPLRLLTSDGLADLPAAFSDQAASTDFDSLLNNPTMPITGIVTPEKVMMMLDEMGITMSQFRDTIHSRQNPLHNNTIEIGCLVGAHCLAKARATLGNDFACWVRIYCLPHGISTPFSDGEILRQLLLHSNNAPTRTNWIEKLTKGKKRHVHMLMNKPPIWEAMRRVAQLPGLWQDIQIGNFAKHLAAHCDDAIVRYWNHINTVWLSVFRGLEGSVQALDVETVRALHYRAPQKSDGDRRHIIILLENNSLFPDIRDERHRARLQQNILQLPVVIPSILTFHENMRYLTIGTRIIERFLLPIKDSEISFSIKKDKDLVRRLQRTWKSPRTSMAEEPDPIESIHHAFPCLLLDALRNFPFLSTEAPLQDVKGQGMVAAPDRYHVRKFHRCATSYGFHIPKNYDDAVAPGSSIPVPATPEHLIARWRGGKPSFETFQELRRNTSWSAIRDSKYDMDCTPTWVLYDVLLAFFGTVIDDTFRTDRNPSMSSPESGDEEDSDVDFSDAPPPSREERRKRKYPHDYSEAHGHGYRVPWIPESSDVEQTVFEEASYKRKRHEATIRKKKDSSAQNTKKKRRAALQLSLEQAQRLIDTRSELSKQPNGVKRKWDRTEADYANVIREESRIPERRETKRRYKRQYAYENPPRKVGRKSKVSRLVRRRRSSDMVASSKQPSFAPQRPQDTTSVSLTPQDGWDLRSMSLDGVREVDEVDESPPQPEILHMEDVQTRQAPESLFSADEDEPQIPEVLVEPAYAIPVEEEEEL